MGDPIIEYEAGNRCESCWGIGKPFGNVTSPKRIRLIAVGFGDGCAPCNGSFILTQTPFRPCVYDYDVAPVWAEVIFGEAATQFTMESPKGVQCYLAVEGLCAISSASGGATLNISIAQPPTPEFLFAKTLGISPSDRTWHEDYEKAGPTEVLRLANLLDRINIYIEYPPEY